MGSRGVVIAVDGYSSCGKSTFAKAIAARLGYVFIDTGAMYRAITLEAIRRRAMVVGGDMDREAIAQIARSVELDFRFNEAKGLSDIYIDGECVADEIRSTEVNDNVSRVSAIEEVRTQLVAMQQAMGRSGGVVMDGRDIGTVVFPEAQIKLFMTADPLIRAKRRYDELTAKGERVTLESIVESIDNRDRADLTREISPLRRADDAIVLDNSSMNVDEQMAWFMELYESKIK
ncbi:MAG: (d)CMP kinase [Rikenellaceae bacterium]